MINSSKNISDLGILILRTGAGSIFIFIHGLAKIQGGPDLWVKLGNSMSNFGITFTPVFWGFMSAFTEFFVPMFIILGLFYRPALTLMIFNMIVALASHFMKLDPWTKIAYPLMVFILFVSMFIIGPGYYSLDEYFKRRKLKK